MARKKSDTPQGDGAADTAPESRDEASGIVAPEPTETAESAAEDATETRAKPWDPEIVPPEAEAASAPVEPTGSGSLWSEPEPAPFHDETAAAHPADSTVTADPAAEREEVAREPVPEAVARPVVDPGEEVHEEEAGPSFASRALAALCLLLIGAGVGIWAAPKIAPQLPSGMAPVADWLTPGQAESAAELAALRAKVDADLAAVQTRLAELPASADVDTRIGSAVGDAEAKLSAEIAAAKSAAGDVDLTAVNQKLAQLDAAVAGQTTELDALKSQLSGAAGQLSDEALGRIDTYKGEVEALRGEMGSVRDAVSGFATRLDEAEARAGREIDAAQAKVDEITAKASTEVNAAGAATGLAQIRTAIAAGQPFAEPLATLGGEAPPAGLSAAADTGVATLSQLRDSYPDAAHAAIRASIMASAADGGVLARSRAFLEAQVSSRSLSPQTGQGTDAVLSRMEDKLRQDDLDGVLAEARNLPSEASAAMADWLAAAQKRAAAVDALATLDASQSTTN